MSEKRMNGPGVHGEVVDGLLGLQARLRAESDIAVDRTKTSDGVAVTEGDLTIRMPAQKRGQQDVASLAERIKRLEGLLDDVERRIGEFDKAVSSPKKP
jgi:hypothetical protein